MKLIQDSSPLSVSILCPAGNPVIHVGLATIVAEVVQPTTGIAWVTLTLLIPFTVKCSKRDWNVPFGFRTSAGREKQSA